MEQPVEAEVALREVEPPAPAGAHQPRHRAARDRDALAAAGAPVQLVLAGRSMRSALVYSLTAARDAVVAEVMVTAGSQVAAGDPLVRLEDEAET